MPVNYQIKSQLAKLLATEDLVVENRNVETAQFNVDTRVLTLPNWKRASESVYDMLVGHEVGHALYTPNVDPPIHIPHQFVNVTEDARIEKLIKRRYPGLSKTFYKAYNELSDDDFFCLEDEDVDAMNLADRANLWFKIGGFIDLTFTEDEQKIIDVIGASETYNDACVAAEMLYAYCKDQHEQQQQQQSKSQQPDKETKSNSENQQIESSPSSEMEEGEVDTESKFEQEQEENTETSNSNIKVQTDETFQEGAQEFNSAADFGQSLYCEVPNVDLNQIVISNQDVHDELGGNWIAEALDKPWYGRDGRVEQILKGSDYSSVDTEYAKFKKSAQKEVSYMVKEFECKKSADAYSRSAVSRTGVLDCTKLHTYKYNEDLFRKVTVVPDGKNHGLIFILDWSGSMQDCLLDTIKQLYNLIWFCNKVNIPFDVYAFTNNYQKKSFEWKHDLSEYTHSEMKEGMFTIDPQFSLMKFFTSDVKRNELEKQLLSIWRVAYSINKWVNYTIPSNFGLSGTPLNESLICLHSIIPEFKKTNGVQKAHCVILTDGEANHLSVLTNYQYKGEERLGSTRLTMNSYVRNRKTGYTYAVPKEYYNFTGILLEDLQQSFPEVNFIGIRLTCGRELRSFIRRYHILTETEEKMIRKEKSFTIKDSGYTKYFGILTSSLHMDTDFDVDEGASKAKIKSAFVKNLKAKALNKKVLSQFMDLVC